MKTIMVVFGTRPEAIKMAPVVRALKNRGDRFRTLTCVTAQHRQMVDHFLDVFGIRPDFDLDIMRPDQDLFDITARVLTGMRGVFTASRPDLVLVHGDTTTAFAATLAAFYASIPVGHVEAGLRTHDLASPFPEEANRQLTDRLARFHFAPTEKNRQALLAEGVPDAAILVTGNTVIDALFLMLERIRTDAGLKERIVRDILTAGYPLPRLDAGRRLILITGHRRENFGAGFAAICEAIRDLAALYPDVDLLYPVHLNPNVQKPVQAILSGIPNVFLAPPLSYEPFVYLMEKSHLILTDSGGIQEEAPSLGKPTLVMREVTERQEAVDAGCVKLVGADRARIVAGVEQLLTDADVYRRMSTAANPFGDGRAAERIAEFLAGSGLLGKEHPGHALDAPSPPRPH